MGAHFDDWHDTYHQALAATEAAGNRHGQAVVTMMLAEYYHARRRLATTKLYSDRALSLFEQLDDHYGYALALRRSSQYQRHGGRIGKAVAAARKAHELLVAFGDPAAAADCLVLEGIAYLDGGGNPAEAANVLAQAVKAARHAGSRNILAYGSYWLTLAHLALGNLGEAATAEAELSEFVKTSDHQIGVVYARHARGRLYLGMGDLAKARREFLAGLAGARNVRDSLMQVRILTDLGELDLTEGKYPEATGTLTEAVNVSQDLDYALWRARPLQRLGDGLAAAGDQDGASAARQEANTILARVDFP
jgi:tetratricopeptide (TPR) repeat protein